MRGDPGLMGPPGRPGEQGLAVSTRRSSSNYHDCDQYSYCSLICREILVHLAKLEHPAFLVKKFSTINGFIQLIEN
jgi:hypothetical protein